MTRIVVVALVLLPATATAAPATFDVRVTWSAIGPTPGCYFFSGPERTGRERRHQEHPDRSHGGE